MKRLLQILLVTGLLVLFAGAVASADSGSPVLKAMATASGQTRLVWPFASGDTPQYSLDGITWVQIPVGGNAVRLTENPDGDNVVMGLVNYTNYYFRVRHSNAAFSTIADAFPPEEHAHKYFAADTNMCAQCHSTHTATGVSLTKYASVDAVCQSCHAGTGSKYQVDDGTVQGATGLLTTLGGPFGTRINNSASVTPTSAHMLGATLTTAPGGDAGNGNGQWSAPLGCGSCHTAHSNGGYQYRLLRTKMPNMKDAGGNALGSIVVDAYAVTGAGKEYGVYVSGMNALCGGCHADYNTTNVASPSTTRSGVFNTAFYRHAVGKDVRNSGLVTTLPLEASTTGAFLSDGSPHSSGVVACVTCHKPHGVTTVSQGSSSLLVMSNRGVCQDCHKK